MGKWQMYGQWLTDPFGDRFRAWCSLAFRGVRLGRSWETGAALDPGLKLVQLQSILSMLVSGVPALLPVENGGLGSLVCLLPRHASKTWSCTAHFHS